VSNEVGKSEVTPAEAPGATAADGKAAKPPKKRGKARIIILVVVIVVVLLFGGGGVVYATQHANPQFCNVVCHTPMDPYVNSYMEGVSVNAQQTDLEYPLDITAHKDSDQDIVCLTCHTDGIDAQIQEGIAWVSGDYSVPLEELTLTVKPPTAPHQRSGIDTCLTAGCHEGISSLDELKESTSDQKRNPHESHNGDMNCTNCHQMHAQSVLFCTQCHADAVVPDGWLTYAEQQKQIKEAGATS
jgi:hypothetical protein